MIKNQIKKISILKNNLLNRNQSSKSNNNQEILSQIDGKFLNKNHQFKNEIGSKIQKSDDGNSLKYEGYQDENSLCSGNGKLTVFDKRGDVLSSQEGEFRNNKPHGKGIYNFQADEGLMMDGEFKEGEFTGIGRKENGEGTQIGSFSNGLLNGEGQVQLSSGDVFLGYFKEDLPNGECKLFCISGDTQIGNFVEGRLEGKGSVLYASGTKQIGSFKNGLKDGYGELTYVNQNKQVGSFLEDKFDGVGKLYMNRMNDQSIHTEKDNNQEIEEKEPIQQIEQQGNFKDNLFEGKGVLKNLIDKTIYKGEFKKGEKWGKGKITELISNNSKEGVMIDGKFLENEQIENKQNNQQLKGKLYKPSSRKMRFKNKNELIEPNKDELL